MALFEITPETSVYTTTSSAFSSNAPGTNTLIVDVGAYLISNKPTSSFGISLGSAGVWTITILGSVLSSNDQGIITGITGPTTNRVTIGIGADGSVGGFSGIFAQSSVSITNAGVITGRGSSGIGWSIQNPNLTNIIKNSGTIFGEQFSLREHGEVITAADKVTNSGTLQGDVDLGGSNDSLTNLGDIVGRVLLGSGSDTLTNGGVIIGDIFLGDENDVFTNFKKVGTKVKHGISTVIDLGDGDDKFFGGKNAETVRDGNGSDTINLGDGNDVYVATGAPGSDGTDIVKGGAGIDDYIPSSASSIVLINLDSVQHDRGPLNPGIDVVAANTALGSSVAGSFKDVITGFENAHGGSNDDTIYGSSAANVLSGFGGGDHLFGFGGNDNLLGGSGVDRLVGGAGKDVLSGGSDGTLDYFIFLKLSDSGVTKSTRDVIEDFEDGIDQIHLFHIDAISTNAAGTNDAFHFIGENVYWDNSGPGQLRSYWTATGHIIEGDVNGDKKADFSIEVVDADHSIVFTSDDFFL